MLEEQKAVVWYMDGNDLKHSDKIIVKLNYKGLEIAVLKENLKKRMQALLIKGNNNEYWLLGGIHFVTFKCFEKVINNPFAEEKEHCDYIFKKYKENDCVKEFFDYKIAARWSFNKCDVEYIRRYYPQIYEEAKIRQIMTEQNVKFDHSYEGAIAYDKIVEQTRKILRSNQRTTTIRNKKEREAR